jgi:arsenite-transporting ATPase
MSDQVSPAIVNEIDRQIELAHRTPGAHEAALFDRVIEVLRDADDWDHVIFDTAPTGGTLRLLSLPDVLGEWIDRLVEKRLASIDLFEKAAIGGKEARRRAEDDPIVAHLREREERFEFAGRVLREDADFYLVLNPDDLSIRETRRAVDAMADQGLSVDGLVVNKVTPAPDDDEAGRGATYLRERVATERERIERIRREFEEPVLAVVESRVAEVKGELLADVADELDVEVSQESVET